MIVVLAFWICLGCIAYTYIGYIAVLWIQVKLRRWPIANGDFKPTVSVVIAARNEEANLAAKLEGLRHLDYPRELLQVVVASDGSTDRTADILRQESSWVVPVILEHSVGKAYALNEAVRSATGEVLVFLDARQLVEPNAVSELAACFADQSVGAVSGELLLEGAPGVQAGEALGIYWKIEKAIRKLESASGSVIGVTGAIYAIRRELYPEIPAGTILDDVFVPMCVAKQGKRIVFQPKATARDRIFAQKGKEFSRKVRTLTGNYQLLKLAPWLLSPKNPLLFRFVCHKMLRLAVPLLLIMLLIASWAAGGEFYHAVFWVQIAFYALAELGAAIPATRSFKPVAIANTFVMLNLAAFVAFCNFVTGKDQVWT